jgi:IMP cyclohydrolase
MERSFFMHKYCIVISLLTFCACGNNSATISSGNDTALSSQTIHTNVQDTIVTGAKPMMLNGCYQMTLKQDTATLHLNVRDTTVTGNLVYAWHQKDRNTGTLSGVLRNDTIYADYTFQAEGSTSLREVIFKIENGTLLQGFGDITEHNGKVVFQDRSRLQFQKANPFLKIMCP